MAVNKVDYAGQTLIDLTADTVTPETLMSGVTAHDASGNPIVGTLKPIGKWQKIAEGVAGVVISDIASYSELLIVIVPRQDTLIWNTIVTIPTSFLTTLGGVIPFYGNAAWEGVDWYGRVAFKSDTYQIYYQQCYLTGTNDPTNAKLIVYGR